MPVGDSSYVEAKSYHGIVIHNFTWASFTFHHLNSGDSLAKEESHPMHALSLPAFSALREGHELTLHCGLTGNVS